MLLPARFLHGAAEACVYTGGLVWVVGMVAPERRGRAIGLYGLCVWSGFTIGPPLGQIAHELGGFNAVWALAAVPPALGALVVSRLPAAPEPSEHEGRRQLLPPGSVKPGIGGGLAGIGIAAINGFVVLLCIDRGFGQASGAVAIALFAFATLVGRLVAGGLPDRLGPRRTMVIAVALGGSGQALIAVAPAWWAVGLGCVLFGFCWTLLFPALAMLVVDAVEPSQRGAGLAAYSSFFDLGFVRRRADARPDRVAARLRRPVRDRRGPGHLLAGIGGRAPGVAALSFGREALPRPDLRLPDERARFRADQGPAGVIREWGRRRERPRPTCWCSTPARSVRRPTSGSCRT